MACRRTQEATCAITITPLYVAPGLPSSKPLAYLVPLFHAMAAAEVAENGDMSAIDALLGCPLLLPE